MNRTNSRISRKGIVPYGAIIASIIGLVLAFPLWGEEKGAATAPGAEFSYRAEGQRDPFHSIFLALRSQEKERELRVFQEKIALQKSSRVKEPLEEFSLEKLKLVATLEAAGKPVAMVQDPSGKAYTVQMNDYMGQNEGRVTRIRTGAVELLEKIPTPERPNATRVTVLRIHEEPNP